MKKIFSFFAAAAMAVMLASCGGKTAQNTTEEDSTKTFEQEQIEAAIKMHLDSMVVAMGDKDLKPLNKKIKDGDFTLSDEEIKVKPDYLLDPAMANDLVTAAQKYAGLVMLAYDMDVAELYKMDTADYKEAVMKLGADLNDPAFKIAQEADGKDFGKTLNDMYKAEADAGRINFYWIGSCAATVETIYIMSQNIDKFLGGYTDDQVANVTFRLICILDALDRLSVYDPQIPGLAEACEPLKALNATSVEEFKTQLKDMKDQIAASRNALIAGEAF